MVRRFKMDQYNPDMGRMLSSFGYEAVTGDDFDFAVFVGGADVNPSSYGEGCHPYTSFSDDRDKASIKLALEAVNKPWFGVCRGSQFIAVKRGYSLNQHVEGHCGPHGVYNRKAVELFKVTSTHHQVATSKPWSDNPQGQEVLLYSKEGYIEAARYPRAFAVQFHPEWMDPEGPAVQWVKKRLEEVLNGSIT